jgi:hypothetical protein
MTQIDKDTKNQFVLDFNLTEDVLDAPDNNVLAIRAIILSNLFRVANKTKQREYFKEEVLATFNNEAAMTYTGEELRSDDEDFFMYCLEQAREQQIGEHNNFTVNLTHHGIIKELKWDSSSKGYKRLDDTITRLGATSVNISFPNANFDKLPLVRKSKQRDDSNTRSKVMKIFFEPEIFALFMCSKGALLDYDVRYKLTPLAKKIQSILSFDRANICTEKLIDLYKISGSRAKLETFRRQVLGTKKQLIACNLISHMNIDKQGHIHFYKP